MSDWQPIETAPKDGTVIRLKVRKRSFLAAWGRGYGWVAEYDQDHPPSWTDGVCWGSNEHERQSARPTHWKPVSI